MTARTELQPGVLLLAGIAPGLGQAIAQAFAGAGYRVAGLSRDAGTGRTVAEQIQGECRHYVCDVTQVDGFRAALKSVEADFGAPDVLVYNPMQLLIRPFLELDVADMESVWRTGCLGAMIAAQAVLPAMLAAGRGTIIFTGATAAIRGGARFAAFAVGKFGLRALAQSLAREFGPQGVHVAHTILDGLIWAPQTRERFDPAQADCMDPAAIAQTYLHLAQQPRSAWTHELDLRPASGSF